MKYRIRVSETVKATYPAIEIDAENKTEAWDLAETLRIEGKLGEPTEEVEDVDLELLRPIRPVRTK